MKIVSIKSSSIHQIMRCFDGPEHVRAVCQELYCTSSRLSESEEEENLEYIKYSELCAYMAVFFAAHIKLINRMVECLDFKKIEIEEDQWICMDDVKPTFHRMITFLYEDKSFKGRFMGTNPDGLHACMVTEGEEEGKVFIGVTHWRVNLAEMNA